MHSKPVVIVVDDDRFHLGNIKLELSNYAEIHSYHPRDFDDLEDFSAFESAHIALIDWHFNGYTALDSKVLEFLHDHGFKGKALLCSLHEVESDRKEIEKKFDGVLQKADLTWDKIEKFRLEA